MRSAVLSMTIALYGLFVLYGLTRKLLADGRRRPLAKFTFLKLLVAIVL
jgi:hypothetical protein